MAAGRSGLLHAITGAGKSLEAWFGPLWVYRAEPSLASVSGVQVMWMMPMRALATVAAAALWVSSAKLNQCCGDECTACAPEQREVTRPALVG